MNYFIKHDELLDKLSLAEMAARMNINLHSDFVSDLNRFKGIDKIFDDIFININDE